MISEFFTSIVHASWLPAGMLVAAMISFAAVVIWVIRLDKNVVSEVERLPLDSSDIPHQGENSHV